jgi:hypothetical protein
MPGRHTRESRLMIKSFFDKEKHNSTNWLTQELTLQIGNKHFILSRTAPQTEKKHRIYFLLWLKICGHTCVRSSHLSEIIFLLLEEHVWPSSKELVDFPIVFCSIPNFLMCHSRKEMSFSCNNKEAKIEMFGTGFSQI